MVVLFMIPSHWRVLILVPGLDVELAATSKHSPPTKTAWCLLSRLKHIVGPSDSLSFWHFHICTDHPIAITDCSESLISSFFMSLSYDTPRGRIFPIPLPSTCIQEGKKYNLLGFGGATPITNTLRSTQLQHYQTAWNTRLKSCA
jgi:hypothetical protein